MTEEIKKLLVLNGGSSSIKISLFSEAGGREEEISPEWTKNISINLLESEVEEVAGLIGTGLDAEACSPLSIACVGHRVVHGGVELREPTIINESVEKTIEELSELAPVHNPIALKIIRAARRLFARAAQVAVFDTAFHADLPEDAFVYPLPYEWFQKYKIRRFGFHGINHEYCLNAAAKLLKSKKENLKLVSCHLGNGCSLAAVKGGVCVDTSMGFTPLEGLMMGARSGSIDPGIIFFLLQKKIFSPEKLEWILNNESGLLGISGRSSDMRDIELSMKGGDEKARLAFDVFSRRVKSGVAAMSASLSGIDTLVFTGGIGEHSSELRKSVCEGLKFLGAQLDEDLNKKCTADGIISSGQSGIRILRIAAREDLQIYRNCLNVINS